MSRYPLIALAILAPILAPLCVSPLAAQEAPTPMEQARFLLRAFLFDRSLVARGDLRIAVLYREDSHEVDPIRVAFAEMGSGGVQGVLVTAVAIRFESVGALLEVFEEERVTAVYIPQTLAGALSSIQQVTRARKLPSLSGGRQLVEQGVSIGVYLSEGMPRLIVNRRSAQVEGLDVSAELLGVSEVIR